MPTNPTYAKISEFAYRITDKANQVYGMFLRGKPGWGREHVLRHHAYVDGPHHAAGKIPEEAMSGSAANGEAKAGG